MAKLVPTKHTMASWTRTSGLSLKRVKVFLASKVVSSALQIIAHSLRTTTSTSTSADAQMAITALQAAIHRSLAILAK
jgi:hypothetical protein